MRRALLAMTALLMADAATAREPWRAVIDLHLGGLRAGEVTVAVTWDGPRYTARTDLRASGLAALLLSVGATAQAEGALAGDRLAPVVFEADGRFGKATQTVRMDYANGSPLPLSAEPPLRRRPYDAAPEALTGALDPLSAVVAALTPRPVAQACGASIPVFDSRRRYDLHLAAPQAIPGGVRCAGEMERVAGFKRAPREPERFTLDWRVADGIAYPARAVAPTAFGMAVARVRD